MAYRKIDPRLWDDEWFVKLTPIEKLIWMYALTGPHTTNLPGMWLVGIHGFVDGLRLPEATIEAALDKFQRAGRIAFNPRLRLLRVPNAPKYNRPDNARALRAWFKLWSTMPECQQKYDHLDALRESVASQDPDPEPESQDQPTRRQVIQGAWKTTFGAVAVPKQFLPRTRTRAGVNREDARESKANSATEFANSDRTSSRTDRSASAKCTLNIDPALDRVLSEDPEGETSPETARAGRVKFIGPDAQAILDRLSRRDVLRSVADTETAEAIAAVVLTGRVTMEGALDGIDHVADAYASSRSKQAKAPAELAQWITNRMKAVPRGERHRPTGQHPGAPAPSKPAFAPLAANERPWSPEDA